MTKDKPTISSERYYALAEEYHSGKPYSFDHWVTALGVEIDFGSETNKAGEEVSKKYTAEDFSKAEFAKHPDGDHAVRVDPGDGYPWRSVNSVGEGEWYTDQGMAELGWMPVPTTTPVPATLTEADLTDALVGVNPEFEVFVRDFLYECLWTLGIDVVPVQKPTNVERLAAMYQEWVQDGGYPSEDFLHYFDRHGVKAPGGAGRE